jgi:hypothetical protein
MVAEKVAEYVGVYSLVVSFRNVADHTTSPLQVFMVLILLGIEAFYGMNWLACSVDGICLGTLKVILMSLASPVKGQVRLVYVLP